MTDTYGTPNAESHERLRRSARDLIDHGVTPPSRGGNLSIDALQLLYERARTPEYAADALKLLHELQTYQVELDLLYEQLQANEHEIGEELAYYRSLYEQAPAAYLVVTNDGEIIEGNQAAGVVFGQSTTDLAGKALGIFLAPGQEDVLNTLLRNPGEQARGSQDIGNRSVELPDHRWLRIDAKPATTTDRVLVILTETAAHSAKF